MNRSLIMETWRRNMELLELRQIVPWLHEQMVDALRHEVRHGNERTARERRAEILEDTCGPCAEK